MKTYKKPFVIAEIGCNHKGDMEIAKELIKVAKIFCNADAVKFQKRNNKENLFEQKKLRKSVFKFSCIGT